MKFQEGNRYLVTKQTDETIREWACVEVTEHAVKFNPIVSLNSNWITGDVSKPFWILQKDIDVVSAKYLVIEELGPDLKP